jgi:hypothetical protein
MPDTQETNEQKKGSESAIENPPWVILALLSGLITALLILYAWSARSQTLLVVEVIFELSSMVVGGLFGFLFGLPRTTTTDGQVAVRTDAATTVSDMAGLPTSHPSNNLEQVSDWLTKILIGIGLVQVGAIRDGLINIGSTVGTTVLTGVAGAAVVTELTIVSFLIVGFLASFLWTRIRYPRIQSLADTGVWAEVRRLTRMANETQQAVKLVATGALQPQTTQEPSSDEALQLRLTTIDNQWPQELKDKVQEFLDAPIDWNADPTADIFPNILPAANGRRLDAEILVTLDGALILGIKVRRTGGNPLIGKVTFLLHPTFRDRAVAVDAVAGVAEDKVYSEGAFTVVAIMDGGATILSYDLSTLPNAPEWFTST